MEKPYQHNLLSLLIYFIALLLFTFFAAFICILAVFHRPQSFPLGLGEAVAAGVLLYSAVYYWMISGRLVREVQVLKDGNLQFKTLFKSQTIKLDEIQALYCYGGFGTYLGTLVRIRMKAKSLYLIFFFYPWVFDFSRHELFVYLLGMRPDLQVQYKSFILNLQK